MLIPGLTLTPGLAERLRACGEEMLIVIPVTGSYVVESHPCGAVGSWVPGAQPTPVADYPRMIWSDGSIGFAIKPPANPGPRPLRRVWEASPESGYLLWVPEAVGATGGQAATQALRSDGSELSEHEQRRVEGVLAAHAIESF